MRRKNQAPTWQEVVYEERSQVPMERWGHQLVKVSENKVILFGGFGGTSSEGKYLDDLWEFNTSTFTWKQLHHRGQIPQKRSNYVIHHNPIDHQLILFGGGSSNKIRYNDVCILDLATLTWSKCIPDPSEQSPWERTYHTGVFLFPFMVVFGGEGGPNIDLDDSWTFNIQTKKWRRLCFEQNQQAPERRRFHSSVLIGTTMYIISGCKNGNYDLFGDVHRVDLKSLQEQNHVEPLVWQRVVQNNSSLRRWGQSCEVFDGKIYIFAGRVSQSSDTNNIIVYNPENNSVQQVKTSDRNLPNPRRRHSSIMIGSSLLIFGGYNGKYYHDFHFLPLKGLNNKSLSQEAKIYSHKQFEAQLSLTQMNIQQTCLLQVHSQQSIVKIKCNESIFNKNQYLKNIRKYSDNQNEIKIILPNFCSLTSFRVINHFLSQNIPIFSSDNSLQFVLQLLKLAEYFNCEQIYPFIESQIIKFLTRDNAKSLLKWCIKYPLYSFINAAIDFIIENRINFQADTLNFEEDNIETSNNLRAQSQVIIQSRQDYLIFQRLKQAQQSSQFQIQQSLLRKKNASLFTKASNTIKSVFSSRQDEGNTTKPASESLQQKGGHPGCFQRFINFFSSLSFVGGRG